MTFRVIQGTFHVVGYSPDGDSVRFKAQNEANWALLEGQAVKLNKKGHAQLVGALHDLDKFSGVFFPVSAAQRIASQAYL